MFCRLIFKGFRP